MWRDQGILLDCYRLGERHWVVTLLTPERGRVRSVAKAPHPSWILGGGYDVLWNGRLEDQLGTMRLDGPQGIHVWSALEHPLVGDAVSLICVLCQNLLPERTPFEHVFSVVWKTLEALGTPQGLHILDHCEHMLFVELGYCPTALSHRSLWDRLCYRQHLFEKTWPQLTRLHQARQHFLSKVRQWRHHTIQVQQKGGQTSVKHAMITNKTL